MLIKHSRDSRETAPQSFSDWERTYNKAIDLVSEAVGHSKKIDPRLVVAVRLKPTMYKLLVEGVKVLMARRGMQWDDMVELTHEGVLILEGSKAQIDSIKLEYAENAINKKLAN